MKKDYTHISVILDRSGSMKSIRDDVIRGFNSFIDEQKSQPGSATLSLVQFDSVDSYQVLYDAEALEYIGPLDRSIYAPRSKTPLLDTIGRSIIDLELKLARMPTHETPDRIIFVVITDGKENASREFGRTQVNAMIERKQNTDGWQIAFLSADLGAIGEAVNLGVSTDTVMAFDKTAMGMTTSWNSVSSRVSAYRGSQASSIAFTDEDRVRQVSDRERLKRSE
jgi:hypothetical protein